MKCPKCKTKELSKPGFSAPYLCEACAGMWLLSGQLAELPDATIEPLDAEAAVGDSDDKTGLCPSGHGVMIRAKVDIDEPFYLEKCTACGGIWFDKGEWQRIAENHLADNLSNIWSRSWQRKQGQERNRERFLGMNKKLLGVELYDAVMALATQLKDHPEKDRAVALLQQEIG
jgi:Zn-finger nucleic acid-binding protein